LSQPQTESEVNPASSATAKRSFIAFPVWRLRATCS